MRTFASILAALLCTSLALNRIAYEAAFVNKKQAELLHDGTVFERKPMRNEAQAAKVKMHHDATFKRTLTRKEAQPSQAFLVRTYSPTPAMSKRIVQWVSSLKSHPDVHAFISLDQTSNSSESRSRREFLLKELGAVGFDSHNIYKFTLNDVLQAYPALKGSHYREGDGQTGLGLGYQVQPIDMFVQTLPRKHRTYDYLWVFEDDVGYTGDIAKLLQAYSRSSSDLIGGDNHTDYEQTFASQSDRYTRNFHVNGQTDLYRKWVPADQRRRLEEHVLRFSPKLLGKLHDWSVAGAVDVSACMSATVCRIEKMDCSKLKAEDLGTPYTWSKHYAIHTQEAWDALVRKDVAAAHPRLYHPLKQ